MLTHRLSLRLCVAMLVGALAVPALAQTGRQWIVFQNGRAYLVRPRRNAARNRRTNPRRTPRGQKGPERMQGEAVVEIGSEVQALKERHAGFVPKLPQSLRKIEPRVTAKVDRLPLITQYGYYTAIEDYATMSPDDQAQMATVMRSLADLPPDGEQRLNAAVTKEYQGTPPRDKEAVSARQEHRELVRPYDLFFRLQNDLGPAART